MSYLTTKEVYWIALLTKHGWEPDWDVELWKKDGFMNRVPKESNLYGCYLEKDMKDTEWFDLEKAYWEQLGALEVDSKPNDDHDTIPSPPPEGVAKEIGHEQD